MMGKTNAGGFARYASTGGMRYQPYRLCAGLAANHSTPATTPKVQYRSPL